MNLQTTPQRKQGEIYSEAVTNVLAILKQGPGTAAVLSVRMARLPGWRDDAKHARLRRILYKLSQRDQAHRRIVGGQLVWAYGSEEMPEQPGAGACTVQPPQIVPPRQHDIMRAPAYDPGRGPALRPGALDHKRWASAGVRF